MKCERCEARGKTWQGDDPVCAFDDKGEFRLENWNCATMSELRGNADDRSVWSEDSNAVLLPLDGSFICLKWYKSRGRTDLAIVLEGNEIRNMRLTDAEEFLISAKAMQERGDGEVSKV